MPENTQMHEIMATDFAAMEGALLAWFAKEKRPLPWREHYEPYSVWISEIMLQQTQMERGVAYYLEWMRLFPDIHALAGASEEAVLKAWEGLGYYSRARNILKAAKMVEEKFGGVFPSEAAEIRSLPGIGPYTAAAIASIAFGRNEVCIDANVERVVSRLFDLDACVRQKGGRAQVEELAAHLLQKGHAREHNQAMMELGALVCGKKARCPSCPLEKYCLAHLRGTWTIRPVLPKSPEKIKLNVATGVLLHEGKIYVQKRLPKDVWGSLWEFPGGGIEADECPEEAVVREFREETGFAVKVAGNLGIVRHSYTKYHVTLNCFFLRLADKTGACPAPPDLHEASDWRWLDPPELADYAMPSAHRTLANALSLQNGKIVSSLVKPKPGLLPLAQE